jgi:murein DD-endopeptidase MepM/ murein hydrolase activator NlpD
MTTAMMPLKGQMGKNWKVTSYMGWRVHPVQKTRKHHNGTDMIYISGTERGVYAPYAGTVTYAGPSKTKKADGEPSGFGYYVKITHKINGQFYSSLYAHLVKGSLKVKQGDKVKAGDLLGTMGTSGMSTGVHLHWEIWKGQTHGWSDDGKGFVEPIEFMKSVIALEGAAAYADVGSTKSNVASSPKTPGAAAKPIEPAPEPKKAPAPQASPKASAAPKPSSKASPKATAAKPKPAEKAKTHTVASGDTLGKIATKYKTTVSELAKINKITNVNSISIGQVIKLP